MFQNDPECADINVSSSLPVRQQPNGIGAIRVLIIYFIIAIVNIAITRRSRKQIISPREKEHVFISFFFNLSSYVIRRASLIGQLVNECERKAIAFILIQNNGTIGGYVLNAL